MSYVRDHFTSIFPSNNDVFGKDLELLFECLEVRRIDLNLLYSSKQNHDHELLTGIVSIIQVALLKNSSNNNFLVCS